MRAAISVALILLGAVTASAQQKEKPKWAPSPHIAATDPLRPEEQLKKLKAPPGFEIQLVAADPDIRKPINIAFDAAGRLWVTETIEYPHPAEPGKERDAVKILEDFGPDGRARKITTFADKLNIPIGVIPDVNAKGALVYSIPSITHMLDTKGLGKADVRDPLYTGFGFDDTHGMTGEFQMGFDGWIYACHGFRNASNVKSKDGATSISMTSGNTYRIKPDGSRIEHYTHGQVNPFGLTFDPYGNLYSGDCHSRPLTMLIRGALYEHFANKHDGLGFAPHMNTFKDHSTALCGVTYYAADHYPKEYHGKLFLGDVVLNRLNAYKLEWTGSTPKAVMENFITSQDPWFRPVDIKLGPDGCLYFADFYNRIIGHYEVDLKHPGRDRDKGRIWRVVYRGKDGKNGPQPVTDLTKVGVRTLVQALAHANLTVRLHATHQLVERGGKEGSDACQEIVAKIGDVGNGIQKVHALWVLERLGGVDDKTLASAIDAQEKIVRVHAQRILTERKSWSQDLLAKSHLGIADKDALVQRIAAEALAAHPHVAHLGPLLEARQKIPAGDTHLLHAVRLALRDHLRSTVRNQIPFDKFSERDQRAFADVILGVHNEKSAEFLKAHMLRYPETVTSAQQYIHYIVRYGPDGSVAWALDDYIKKHPKNLGLHGGVLKAASQAAQERGIKFTNADRAAAEAIIDALLKSTQAADKQSGAELAGSLKVASARPTLLTMISAKDAPDAVRKACVTSLVNIDVKSSIEPLVQLILNENEPFGLREQIARDLGATNHPQAQDGLLKAMQNAPARLEFAIAFGLTGNKQGVEKLLKAIEAGKISPRILQQRAIFLRLEAAKVPVGDRIDKLLRGLPTIDQKTQALISKKRDSFVASKADVDAGQKIFQKNCGNCHQINNQGAKIGPQLDGIGIRGVERLLEDILDPSRNVDQAFRTTVISTKQGQTITGLFLREEGNVVILADNLGKDVRIDKATIDDRSLSPLSPMPANFAESISDADFNHLLAYLLAQRGKSEK